MKQRYSIALLILIYAVGTIGLFTTYYTSYHRLAFQVQVRETKEDELTKLLFSEQEYESIVWMEEETEFEWHGKLYDVSKISRTKGGYMILCENDSLEEALLSFLKSTKGNRDDRGSTKGSPQPQFFSVGLIFTEMNLQKEREPLPSTLCFYCSIYPGIHLPPPKS